MITFTFVHVIVKFSIKATVRAPVGDIVIPIDAFVVYAARVKIFTFYSSIL